MSSPSQEAVHSGIGTGGKSVDIDERIELYFHIVGGVFKGCLKFCDFDFVLANLLKDVLYCLLAAVDGIWWCRHVDVILEEVSLSSEISRVI